MSDKHIKFTIAALNAIPPPLSGRDTYHDTKEPGLLVRVGPNGKKQFSVFKRVKHGNPVRITIGPFPDLTIAAGWLGRICNGICLTTRGCCKCKPYAGDPKSYEIVLVACPTGIEPVTLSLEG